MAFNLFNKNGNTESHPEEGKEKAYSSAINKLSGLFGHKNSETVEKKEPEVPQAGGMEETENIFNINFQNEKDSLQMAESQAEPSLESLNFQNDLTDFSTEDDEKTQEDMSLPQDVSSDVSGAELGDETETSLWEDATQTQQSMASDIGHENVFNDGVSRELEAIDNGSDDFVFHENPSESSSVSFEQSQNNKVADSVFGTEENLVVDETPKSVEIGHDVWIGEDACIMGGVKIHTGAVIGAKAVVTKDIPPYAVAVGVPAKVIKYRFEKDIIGRLLKSCWWDLPYEFIKTLPFNNIEESLNLIENYSDFK